MRMEKGALGIKRIKTPRVKFNNSGLIDFSDFLEFAVAVKEVLLLKKLQKFLEDGNKEVTKKRFNHTANISESTNGDVIDHKLVAPSNNIEIEEEQQRKDGILGEKEEVSRKANGSGQGSVGEGEDNSLTTRIVRKNLLEDSNRMKKMYEDDYLKQYCESLILSKLVRRDQKWKIISWGWGRSNYCTQAATQ